MRLKGEVVSANEALARVGCAHLQTADLERVRVEWVGHPVAFACGHNRSSDGARVSKHICGGYVLFSWNRVSGEVGKEYHLRGDFHVSVDQRAGDTFLHVGISC